MATYLELINSAIQSFDNVWGSLKNKDGLLTQDQKDVKDGHLVATSSYGTLVNKLVSITENGALFDGSSLHTIERINSGSQVLDLATTSPVVKNGASYVISANLKKAAYYTTVPTLTVAVPTTDVTFSHTLEGIVDGGDALPYTLSYQDKLIGTLTVNKGDVDVTLDETGITNTLSTSIGTLTVDKANSNINYTILQNSDTTTDNYYINIKAAAATTGKISAVANKTVTTGYVVGTGEAEEVKNEVTISEGLEASKDIRIEIPRGSVTVSSASNSNAKADITATGNLGNSIWSVDAEGNPLATSIPLNAAVSGVELTGTFKEGYVVSDDKINVGAITIPGTTKYIKVGEVDDQSVTANVTVTEDTLGIVDASTGVSIKVGADASQAVDFTAGFVSSAGNITVSGEKEIKIKKASEVKTTATITKMDVDGSVLTDDTTGYEITITPTLTNVASLGGKGLVMSKDEITAAITTPTATKAYVARGNITIGDLSFAMDGSVGNQGSADDGEGEVNFADVFKDAAPATGDYFKVRSAITVSNTAGYVEANTAGTTKFVEKYVPKAVVELVQTKDDDGSVTEEYFQVKSAGYLPSGTIKNVSAVEPSTATVTLAATSNTGLSIVKQAESGKSYHTITLSKSAVSAGYISDTKGTLAGTTWYVEKGSVSATPSVTDFAPKTISRVIDPTSKAVSYELPVEITVAHGASVTNGYITSDEVNLSQPVTDDSNKITLSRATFETGTHSTTVANTPSTGLDTADSGAYYITPSVTSCSATINITGDGYVSAADASDLKFEFPTGHAVTGGVIYIKPGNKEKSTLENTSNAGLVADVLDANGKITSTSNGAYSVKVSGNVSTKMTLETGYYGAAEKEITKSIAVEKEITVAHGSANVSVNSSSSNAITATDATAANKVKLYAESDASGEGRVFSQLSATASINTTTTLVEGYVKSGDVKDVTAAAVTSKSYVELYNNASTEVVDGETVYKVVVGQDAATLPESAPTSNSSKIVEVGEKYSTKDINVSLSDNAMGKNVINQLLALEARLIGANAK